MLLLPNKELPPERDGQKTTRFSYALNILLVLCFVLLLLFFGGIGELSAQCCGCNYSFCTLGGTDGGGLACVAPNPNNFYGGQYNDKCSPPGSGLNCCEDTSTCGRLTGNAGDVTFDLISCSSCTAGYGQTYFCDWGLPTTFNMCVPNCGASSECYGISDRGCGCGGSEELRQFSQWCPSGWRYWCETSSTDHPCSCESGDGLRIVESNYTNETNRSVVYRRTDVESGGVNRGIISDDINSGLGCDDENGDVYRTYGGLIPHQTSASPRGYIYLFAGTYEFISSGCKSGRICMADPCYLNWCWPHEGLSLAVNNMWLIGNSTTYVSYGGTNTPWTTNNCEPDSILSSQITIPVSGWYPFEFNERYHPRFTSTLSYRPVGTSTWLPITYDMLSSCGSLTPPNSPPTCSISGPTSVVASYPIQYRVIGNDPDSNLSSMVVKYSLTSNTAGFTSISVTGVTSTGYDGFVTVPGLSAGTYYVGCEAQDALGIQCYANPWCSGCLNDCGASDYLTLTVSDYITPWFQIVGGDVIAGGNVSSTIPATAYNLNFIRDPVGLLIYSGNLPSLGSGVVSITEAAVNTIVNSKPEASFDLFYNKKTPEDVKTAMTKLTSSSSISAPSLSSCNTVRGYKVCYYDGAYNPGSGALGNLILTDNYTLPDGDRIILFVDNASVTIQGNIRPQTRGLSSFLVISEGVASASPSGPGVGIVIETTVGGIGTFADNVPDLEGVFYTDRTFVTSHTTGVEDRNLHIRGSVVAGSFNLGRDLGSGATGEKNDRYPAEYFEFGTEQVMAFPPFLRLRSTSWSEVAP